MFENLEKSWKNKLQDELELPYTKELETFLLEEEKNKQIIYPPKHLIFEAFKETLFDQVQVVLIGQDPYHGPGQAHGLSFSVPAGVSIPPSLKNIFQELVSDLKVPMPKIGCLSSWAKQGVLLLNATLTVRKSDPKSHHGRGWERFTDAVVYQLAMRNDPVIFVLWGKSAQEKGEKIMSLSLPVKHAVLKAAHPSPYSAYNGFFGCRHFSKINYFLEKLGKQPIFWSLD